MREPIESMERWYRKGRRFALAQVVGSSGGAGPRDAGALMAVNELGDVAGSVSGGCVEGAVVEAALEALESGEARTLVFSGDEELATAETWGLDVPCGGAFRIEVRPLDDEVLALMRKAREAQQAAPRIVCVGAVHVAAALCALARQVGYRCLVVDPRRTFTRTARIRENADEVLEAWPQEALPALGLGRQDAVCALSHDAKIDTPALASALRGDAGYIGCLGHAETLMDRREALCAMCFTDADLARVRGPIGMFLGGREPEEIALSALAQIQAARHGRLSRVGDLPGCTLDLFTPEFVEGIAARRESMAVRGERLASYREAWDGTACREGAAGAVGAAGAAWGASTAAATSAGHAAAQTPLAEGEAPACA